MITEKGDTEYKCSFDDPLAAEIQKIVPKTTIGPPFTFHPSVDHLQISLGGMHGSCYPLLRDAAKTGRAVEDLLKIGKALSSPVMTLDAVCGMRKSLADLIVLWDTGEVSEKAGTGKNILPSHDLPNSDISIANTIKNVTGARFTGSKTDLAALDSVVAQHAKMAEALRQMYAVRMSCQAEATDRMLAAAQEARDSSGSSAEEVTVRTAALTRAHTDLVFVRAQMSAQSALFKALFLVLPGIVSAKILPQETDKDMTRQTASLIPVEELVRLQQLDEMRTEMSAASTTTTPVSAKKKEAKDKAAKPDKFKASRTKRRSDFSNRSPATPASGGAAQSADDDRTKSQKNNDKKRRKKQAAKAAEQQRADDNDNSSGRGGDSPSAAGNGAPSDKHDKGGASGSGGKRGSQPGDKTKSKKHHKDKHKGK